ncbi:MAG: hypothetical protein V1704_03645 [Candidatus Vogelbacteria bacterium]
MKKYIIVSLLAISFIITPVFVSAQTSQQAQIIRLLQSLIQLLTQQLSMLRLQGQNALSPQQQTGSLSLDALKNMYVTEPNGQLKNGQYLSAPIDCGDVHGTCPSGQRSYLGLDTSVATFGDFNNDGIQNAVVGIRYGYVDGRDDLVTAPADVNTEYLAFAQLVNGQPKIVDRIYGPGDVFGRWNRIKSVTKQGSNIMVDVTETVNYSDATGEHQTRRIYTISVIGNKFNIISVTPYVAG